MKKMIALLLALVMAFALVACGGQENNQTSGNEEGSDKILIGAIYRDLTQTWFEKESTAAKATADELGIDIRRYEGSRHHRIPDPGHGDCHQLHSPRRRPV